MSIGKQNTNKNESGDESVGSSPEDAPAATSSLQENQPPKRKGGRKPIYATSEERKQRNRQAQAAFRERRTEYIKQLEEAIHTHEQNLASLQAAHRSAADECLMLRYKNSLLERILLEKGIDVKTELRAKDGSPTLSTSHLPQNMIPAPRIQRSILNRHHARRSNSAITPKPEPNVAGSPLPPPLSSHISAASPIGRPTPSTHSNSPTTNTFGSGTPPTTSEHMTGPMHPRLSAATAMKGLSMPNPQMSHIAGHGNHHPVHMPQGPQTLDHGRVSNRIQHSPLYPPAAFQNHFKQLDQEYETADVIEENEPPETPIHPLYPSSAFSNDTDEQAMSALSSPVTAGPQNGHHQQMPGPTAPHTQHGAYPSMTQLLEANFDLDPFGLSASMAFPSQFSFDTSHTR